MSGPESASTSPAVHDRLGRALRDLRISVTDRCNFRCVYCMPKEVFGKDYQFLERREILTFEEIARLARIFRGLGIEKIRLTGGEPLVRRNIEQLITVSLDALDDAVFRRLNDVDFPVAKVLEGIDAAAAAGLSPIKVNMVVKRGENDASILPMARHFRESGHILRFIEYMDVGHTNGWRMDDVVPAREIVERIGREWPLEPIDPNYPGEVAERWRYRDGRGELGVIASVTQAFCRTCTRVRLSTEGQLYTCLFATSGHDLRALVRGGASDEDIRAAVSGIWSRRADRYSEIRTSQTARLQKIEMSYIGG